MRQSEREGKTNKKVVEGKALSLTVSFQIAEELNF